MGVTFPNESAEYRTARDQLLTREIDLRREMEAVAEARRALPPGGEVPEDFAFDGLDPEGRQTKVRLSELFREGGDSVVIYQMMFPRYSSDDRPMAQNGGTAQLPAKEQPCPSCTVLLDQLNAAAEHFQAGGGSFAVVAKTRLDNMLALARDRQWDNLRMLSAARTDFKRRYKSEDEKGEQVPLMTVFKRDPDGTIRHFWSSEMGFADPEPGQEPRSNGTVEVFWNMFDLTPDGRPQEFHEQLQYDCCASSGAIGYDGKTDA